MSIKKNAEHPVPEQNGKGKKNWFTYFLDSVEWLGNLLPHPVTLFALFCVGVILISGLADLINLSVPDPRPEGMPGRSPDGFIVANSLMNAEGLRRILLSMVTNFTGFAPLGVVLVALLGVGVAEHSGLIKAAIRIIVLKAASVKPSKPTGNVFLDGLRKPLNYILEPKILVTVAVVFAGIVSNTASEIGYVVLIPLGAVVFLSTGRHPLAGMAAAFAGVSGGYSANFLLGTIDPLLAGLTQEAAQLIAPEYTVHAAVNYYFMAISVPVITFLGTWVTISIVEPKFGKYDPSMAMEELDNEEGLEPLSKEEKSGLIWACISILAMSALIALAVVPENGVLRDPNATTFPANISPFLNGIVALIFIGFIIPGVVYGKIVGTIKSEMDVINGMAKSMSTLGLYIVIVFFAAQFVAFFNWTNLGQIVAVSGANFLNDMNFTGPMVFVGFILISAFTNLMIGSAAAKWAVTAPIFVPMLMLVGYSPEVIQAAYRVGDSVTNVITPMMSYFGLILAFANKYDKNMGIGTIISMMLPYSIFFLIGWTLLFFILVFGLGMPTGPGAEIYFDISTTGGN